jgi:hypothetical protein
MTTETSDLTESTIEVIEQPRGYYTDPKTGAWCTLPWPTDPDERQRIADNSLGPLLIRWAENRLTDEEFEKFGPGLIHHQTGHPWRFTPGQKRFLILWYHFDENGIYVYRRAIKRAAKGSGKDPFAAAHGNIELAGPSQLIWDDEIGGWTGQQHRMPLVQVAANSEDQCKKLLRVANGMWSREAKSWHDIETGETRTLLRGRGRFEVMTSAEASSEGDPATFIILNESHHMTKASGGHALERVCRRNVGKSPEWLQARLVEYTNAHQTGQDSTAQQSYEAWQDKIASRSERQDILYDSIEADPNLSTYDMDELKLSLAQAYSDAPWYHEDRLVGEILDPATPIGESIRFYLNRLAAREDAWVDPGNWDKLARPATVVADREQIAMFLDCSKSSDTTGLVGVRISDGYTFVLGYWKPEKDARGKNILVPRNRVDAVVREAFERYRVMWFGVDPSPAKDDETEAQYWKPTIDAWHQDLHRKVKLWATGSAGAKNGHSVMFDMRLSQYGARERMSAFTEMAEQVVQWIDEDGAFFHDGDAALRLHVHNSRMSPNQWGTSLGKESRDSKNHVDLAVCMVGAHLGRRLVLNNTKIRTGSRGSRPGRTTRGRETFVHN